jgi:hypothetical protein
MSARYAGLRHLINVNVWRVILMQGEQYAFARMADQPDIPIKKGREEEAAKIIKQFGRGPSESPTKAKAASKALVPSKKSVPKARGTKGVQVEKDDSGEPSGEAASTDGPEEGLGLDGGSDESGEEDSRVEKWLKTVEGPE